MDPAFSAPVLATVRYRSGRTARRGCAPLLGLPCPCRPPLLPVDGVRLTTRDAAAAALTPRPTIMYDRVRRNAVQLYEMHDHVDAVSLRRLLRLMEST